MPAKAVTGSWVTESIKWGHFIIINTLINWPYFFDLASLEAIFALQLLNNLSPLKADFKKAKVNPCRYSIGSIKPNLIQIIQLFRVLFSQKPNGALQLADATMGKEDARFAGIISPPWYTALHCGRFPLPPSTLQAHPGSKLFVNTWDW